MWTSRRQIADKFNNCVCKFAEFLSVVTAAWEFTISEKSRIIASFVRADVRYRVGMWFATMVHLLLFCKTFRQTDISILGISARKRQNNEASFIFLKLNWLCVDVLFRSAFVVYVEAAKKLFLVIVSEAIFLHRKSSVSTNSLCCCWRTSGIQTTKARSFPLHPISAPIFIDESSKNGLNGCNLPTRMV